MRKILLILFLAHLASCSTVDPNNAEFYGKVRSVEEQTPIPVEIARQIQQITEGGAVVYQNDFLKLNDKTQLDAVRCLESENCILKLSHEYSEELFVGPTIDADPTQAAGRLPAQQQNQQGQKGIEIDSQGPLMNSYAIDKRGPLGFGKGSGGAKGNTITYIVKKGDTLMEIAFAKYADYLKWRTVYRDNKSKISSPKRMQIGTNLRLNNYKPVNIRKEGKPYRIKKSDTLKSISRKLYGNEAYWKQIWRNNPELIKNPRKIYHGFTLYYEDLDKAPEAENRMPAKEENKQKVINDNK